MSGPSEARRNVLLLTATITPPEGVQLAHRPGGAPPRL